MEKEEVGVQNEVGKEGSSGGSRSSGVISSLTMDLFDALKSSLLLVSCSFVNLNLRWPLPSLFPLLPLAVEVTCMPPLIT